MINRYLDFLAQSPDGLLHALGTSATPARTPPHFSTLVFPFATVTSISTAAAVTFTAAQVLGGLILRNTNGAGRADLLPTVASLVAAFPGFQVGSGFDFHIRQTSGGAETITVTTNTGWTLSGTMTIGQNNAKSFRVVFTNVTPGSEAATLYSLGTVVF